MTTEELRRLFEINLQRSHELEAKYRSGAVMTRKDCNEMRHCTQRLGLVARELWIMLGKPDGFDNLRKPIPLTPLPPSMRPLDLSERNERGIH